MRKELQKKLFQKYPKLFRIKNRKRHFKAIAKFHRDMAKIPFEQKIDILGSMCEESAMPRGIEIQGDGWYWLLDKLCGCIQSCIDRNKLEQIEFKQVKESLGRLVIFTNYENKIINGMIRLAGYLSCSICERCRSNEGNITQTAGPLKTLCVKCR